MPIYPKSHTISDEEFLEYIDGCYNGPKFRPGFRFYGVNYSYEYEDEDEDDDFDLDDDEDSEY